MTAILLLELAHLLLFVYWLGADVGTYYAAKFVGDSRLAPAQRAIAAKIMLGIDIAPRICMPLVLATGVHLAALLGVLPLASAAIGALWLLCAAWLAMVLALHHGSGKPWLPALTRVDFGLRVIVFTALLAWAVLGGLPAWLALKVAAYALTIVCGLMIRIHLKPFGPAFAALMRDGPSADGDATIAAAIARCVPWVWAIWGLLVFCAAAGLKLIGA